MRSVGRKDKFEGPEFRFDGSRLRSLRLARGLSMEDVSERLGDLSKQMISRYESGKSVPPRRVLGRLCEVFGVWPEFFEPNQSVSVHIEGFRNVEDVPIRQEQYQPKRALSSIDFLVSEPSNVSAGLASLTDHPEAAPRATENEVIVHFTKIHGLRPKLQAEISAQLEFALEARLKLNLLSQCRDVSAPRLPVIPQAHSAEEIEAAAERLRAFWGVGSSAIQSVRHLLEVNNIVVFELGLPNRVDGFAFRFLRRQALGSEEGAGVVVRHGSPGDRMRFSMLHELAHLYCLGAEEAYERLERRANMFAAAMLLPRQPLVDHFRSLGSNPSLTDFFEIKREFGISIASIILRARTLKLLTQEQCERLYDEIDDRGWRKTEPMPVEPELPDLVRAKLEKLYREGLLSDQERDWITSTDAALVTKDTSLSWLDIQAESPDRQEFVLRRLVSSTDAANWRDPFESSRTGLR